VASGSGEPEGNGAEATRFPFPLPGANIGEQKAKVNTFFRLSYLSFFFRIIGDRAPVSSGGSLETVTPLYLKNEFVKLRCLLPSFCLLTLFLPVYRSGRVRPTNSHFREAPVFATRMVYLCAALFVFF
jgi:hypothetical protein